MLVPNPSTISPIDLMVALQRSKITVSYIAGIIGSKWIFSGFWV